MQKRVNYFTVHNPSDNFTLGILNANSLKGHTVPQLRLRFVPPVVLVMIQAFHHIEKLFPELIVVQIAKGMSHEDISLKIYTVSTNFFWIQEVMGDFIEHKEGCRRLRLRGVTFTARVAGTELTIGARSKVL
jgi:hypothetical protein